MRQVVALGLACMLTGCASWTPKNVEKDPSKITLATAFISTADGLAAFDDHLAGHYQGLLTCKVDIKFNISATASDGGKDGAEIGAPSSYLDAKLTGEQTSAAAAARSNVVEVILGSGPISGIPNSGGL